MASNNGTSFINNTNSSSSPSRSNFLVPQIIPSHGKNIKMNIKNCTVKKSKLAPPYQKASVPKNPKPSTNLPKPKRKPTLSSPLPTPPPPPPYPSVSSLPTPPPPPPPPPPPYPSVSPLPTPLYPSGTSLPPPYSSVPSISLPPPPPPSTAEAENIIDFELLFNGHDNEYFETNEAVNNIPSINQSLSEAYADIIQNTVGNFEPSHPPASQATIPVITPTMHCKSIENVNIADLLPHETQEYNDIIQRSHITVRWPTSFTQSQMETAKKHFLTATKLFYPVVIREDFLKKFINVVFLGCEEGIPEEVQSLVALLQGNNCALMTPCSNHIHVMMYTSLNTKHKMCLGCRIFRIVYHTSTCQHPIYCAKCFQERVINEFANSRTPTCPQCNLNIENCYFQDHK